MKDMLRCVGGPLDGQWWPAMRGAPVYPVRKALDPNFPPDAGESTSVKLDVIRYRQRQMKGPDGRWHLLFAPEDWDTTQIAQHLERVAPRGFPA